MSSGIGAASGAPELASLAGNAVRWRALQLLGVSGLALVRIVAVARLVPATEMGWFAIAMTAVGIGGVVDLGITPALIHRSAVTQRQYETGWTMNGLRSLVISVALIVGAPAVARLFAAPDATPLVRALALQPLLISLESANLPSLSRELRFRPIAAVRVGAAVLETVLAVGLAELLGGWALVIGALGGATAGSAASYWVAPHRPRIVLSQADARALLGFGGWVFGATFVGTATTWVMRLSLARSLHTGALGLYYVAERVAFLPGGADGGVVGAATFPVYARLRGDARATAMVFRATITGMALLVVPLYAMLIAVAPAIGDRFLGPGWVGGVPLLRLLCVTCVVGIVAESAAPLFQGIGRPQLVVLVEAVQLAALSVVCPWWIPAGGLTGAGWAWMAGGGAATLACALLLSRVVAPSGARIGWRVTLAAVAGLAAAAVSYGLAGTIDGRAGVIVGACAGMLAAAVVVWWAERHWDPGVFRELARVFPELAAVPGIASRSGSLR